MAATESSTLAYNVGPQDGWTLIVDGTTDNVRYLRISAIPCTHPFQIFSGTSSPTAEIGVRVCNEDFKVANYVNGNASKFWIKVINPVPNSTQNSGKLRINVYLDGGASSGGDFQWPDGTIDFGQVIDFSKVWNFS